MIMAASVIKAVRKMGDKLCRVFVLMLITNPSLSFQVN
jgi:hypothetical protein